MPGIWAWLDAWPAFERPARLRGGIAYGNESVLREVEARHQRYLTKLWLTKNVRRLVTRVVAHPGWEREGQGVTRPGRHPPALRLEPPPACLRSSS